MGVLSRDAHIDSVAVVKLVELVESSQMKDSVSDIVVGVLTEHAEIDLWYQQGERLIL